MNSPINFACIHGNDGTGKTTIVKILNERYTQGLSNIYFFERSTNPLDEFKTIKENIEISSLDLATQDNLFNERRKIIDSYENHKIYHIILDADVESLISRVSKRQDYGIYETEKALKYYKNRFIEIGNYYGYPIIQNSNNENLEQVCDEIINVIENLYDQIIQTGLKYINADLLISNDIENLLFDYFKNSKNIECIVYNFINNFNNTSNFNGFVRKIIETEELPFELYLKLYVRYLVKNDIYDCDFDVYPIFKLETEGESKKLYKILFQNEKLSKYNNNYIILLKNTIYSHSQQHTGEIKDLEKIRSTGSQLFLEMMWRNDINHAYNCISNNGIISSKIMETTPIETVFKSNFTGTDKHSYYGYNNFINNTIQYKSSHYIRFDWRNPNHLFLGTNVVDCYYYIIEKFYGKEIFMKKFLTKENNVIPLGDKTISEDIIEDYTNVLKTRELAYKMFCTIKYYMKQVGLDVLDGCFMINKSGTFIYSEINQDCMRIQQNNVSLDKDLWRSGGSSNCEIIIDKWNKFNTIFINYFNNHKYDSVELKIENIFSYNYESIMEEILNDNNYNLPRKYKSLINNVIHYPKKMVFSLKSSYYLKYSEEIKTLNDILIINDDKNTDLIERLCINNYAYCKENIDTIEDINFLLKSSARQVFIDYTLYEKLENKIAYDKRITLIVNEENLSFMTHFLQKTNNKLINVNIEIYDLEKIFNFVNLIRNYVDKIYVSNVQNNLKFFFKMGCIPVIDISTMNYIDIIIDDFLCNQIIVILQDENGNVLNLVNYEKNVLKQCLKNKNIDNHEILKIIVKDDQSSLLIVVNNCKNVKSKFKNQSSIKCNLSNLLNQLNQNNDDNDEHNIAKELLLSQLQTQFNDLIISSKDICKTSLFLEALLKYINFNNLTYVELCNEINRKNWIPKLRAENINYKNNLTIAITYEKYSVYTTDFIEKNFGIKINPLNKKNLKITYTIVNPLLYDKYFSNLEVKFVQMKPKDMINSLSLKIVDGIVTFNTVLNNYPKILNVKLSQVENNMSLCLIKRKNDIIKPFNLWNEEDQIHIACEHDKEVKKYLNYHNVNPKSYMLYKFSGSSESFLINQSNVDFLLCDAIVSSGKTLDENDLEVWNTIIKSDDIQIVYGVSY